MTAPTWQRHDSELAELEARHAADTERWAGADAPSPAPLAAPVAPGPHAETVRRAYLFAGMLGRLDLTTALETVSLLPVPRGQDADEYHRHRAQARQDAAVLRVLLRAQQDLAATLTTTDAPRPPRRRDALAEGR